MQNTTGNGPGSSPPSSGALLTLAGVSKTFGSQAALADVDLEVSPGEVVALVGQNGSGKSTLIKLLAGYHQPDGYVSASLHGRAFPLGSPAVASGSGIGFVHQDLGLVDSLTVMENLAMTRGYATRGGTVSWSRERQRTISALRRIGARIDPGTVVGSLKPSQRVAVAIARALGPQEDSLPTLLVLDEPTAALPAPEVDELFKAIRAATAAGVGVLYVSHRVNEVLEIADRVIVLRNGRRVAIREAAGLDANQLVELIVGAAQSYEPEPSHRSHDDIRMTLRGVAGMTIVRLDLEIAAGEIVGVAGVTGSGREEIASLVAGSAPVRSGEIYLDARRIDRRSISQYRAAGIALVPGDRLRDALVPTFDVAENVTLGRLRDHFRRGFLSMRSERDEAMSWIETLAIKTPDVRANVMSLSGGNQQKVAFARALRRNPLVLVLDEPTQGVDVGATVEIHRLIRQAADEGAAVVLCSTDAEELAQLSDRVCIVRDGRIARELRGSSITVDAIEAESIKADSAKSPRKSSTSRVDTT